MFYKFRCTKCEKETEINIPISEYDTEKNNQFCEECKCKMERVIEWNGIAEGNGEGWFGKNGGKII